MHRDAGAGQVQMSADALFLCEYMRRLVDVAKKKKLAPKRERFVEEYLIDLNATQAAIRAGYSEKTAKSQGQRLLTFDDVAREIERRRERLRKTSITPEKVMEEYLNLLHANMKNYVTWGPSGVKLKRSDELTEEEAAAVAEVAETQAGVKFKLHDKKAVLDSIAKMLGLFVEKQEISGPGGGPVEVVFTKSPEAE